jgi:CBS domain-containing protein
MYTVRHLLQIKGNRVWSIAPKTTVYEALELMAAQNIGAVLVVEGDKIVGIFTERDYARKVILKGKTSKTATVGELMTTEVLYVNPDDAIENCMALMTGKRARHLPVLENGKLVGVISIGDVVKAIISDREIMIRELERYITGGHSTL